MFGRRFLTFRKISLLIISVTVIIIILVRTDGKTLEKVNQHNDGKYIIFHLDLKGAAPKIDYLLKVIDLAAKSGASGILLEYEDMFPYSGILANISALNAYTKNDISKLLAFAKKFNLEIIPLVQTFGHLEFVLKLEQYRHLRELDYFPQEVCPAKREAVELIEEMIRQVLEVHDGVRYLHIGCDEVYHLGACNVCSKHDARSIFINHVKKIAQFIRDTHPGVMPIFWDDMMRHWSPVEIAESRLGHLAQPMVWVYIDDIPRLVPQYVWHAYFKAFPRIWGASAFKGAFGATEIFPDIVRHANNNVAWLPLVKMKQFQGLVLTGWSRYDHFAVLAELLPISIPSLVVNLCLIASRGNQLTAFKNTALILQCPEIFPIKSIKDLKNSHSGFTTCHFPGRDLYTKLSEYSALRYRFQTLFDRKNTNGWVSEYNIKNNYSSPWRVVDLFPDEGFAGQRFKRDLEALKMDMSSILSQYLDEYSVEEWLQQKFEPMELILENMEKDFSKLIDIKSWPRRPLNV